MRTSFVETPWKVRNELRRYLWLPVIRSYFLVNRVSWGVGWRVYGLPLIQRHGRSRIEIGDHLHMRNWFSSNPLGVHHRSILATWAPGAEISIGSQVNMTGTTIVAEARVLIGNHIRIGANCTIIDTDFHPLVARERRATPRAGASRAVVIEDDVFIGMGSMILKGSHIGQGAIVGAGSVVSGTVPPGTVVAGNPARVVRELDDPVADSVARPAG